MTSTDLDPLTGEIVLREHERTLFATDDPVEVLDHARRVADALKTALDQSGMTMQIGRSEHVLIDGWQTAGAMLGVSAHVVWSRPLEAGNGWEARAEARTVDGRVVGSAEAMVTRDERNWRRGDEYALRSMAQTRAMSKALRGPLGFVVTLAGRNATPAEEATAAAAVLPDWAADIPDDALERLEANLDTIVAAAGVTIAKRPAVVVGIGDAITTYCEGVFPAACARLAHLLAQTVTAAAATEPDSTEPEPVPDSPAAAAAPAGPGADDDPVAD